jgi:redox-sensing transcriptional repressor
VAGVRVQPLKELETTFAKQEISIAIIATPVEAAQKAADRAVRAGAQAILNFAPIKLRMSPGVAVREMDVTLELEGLCYLVTEAGAATDVKE